MTSTRYLNKAIHHTAEDFRDVGEAAKADLQRLTRDARIMAERRVFKPTMAAVNGATEMIEQRAKNLSRYVSKHPVATLAGVALGGVLLGLLMHRR
jgi:ElaB/YqjD/DUF883 family membrane-anchored ribosome-binding protein